MDNAILVLTSDSAEKIFAHGGSGDWVANESRLNQCEYIVAVRREIETAQPGNAFLIGRGLTTSPVTDTRLLIHFAEYADISIPNVWPQNEPGRPGSRNPVRYANLKDCGIVPSKIKWLPFPKQKVDMLAGVAPLTIDQAKRGLAKGLGITVDKIEISIRV